MQHTVLQDILDVQDILSQPSPSPPNSSPSLLLPSVWLSPPRKGRYHGQLSALVKGRNRAGRKAETSATSSFPGNILFSSGRIQRKPGLPLLLHTFKSIYAPIHLPCGIQKLRKNIWVFEAAEKARPTLSCSFLICFSL